MAVQEQGVMQSEEKDLSVEEVIAQEKIFSNNNSGTL